MIKKIKILIIFFAINTLFSCSSISIDSVSLDKSVSSIDVIYISDIEIKTEDKTAIAGPVTENLVFALRKRNYKVEIYSKALKQAKKYRYHAALKLYSSKTGDMLDSSDSVIIFFIITDIHSNNEIANIRLTCSECDLKNTENLIIIFNKISERLDRLVKGEV